MRLPKYETKPLPDDNRIFNALNTLRSAVFERHANLQLLSAYREFKQILELTPDHAEKQQRLSHVELGISIYKELLSGGEEAFDKLWSFLEPKTLYDNLDGFYVWKTKNGHICTYSDASTFVAHITYYKVGAGHVVFHVPQ